MACQNPSDVPAVPAFSGMPNGYTAEQTLRTRPKVYRKVVQRLAQGDPIDRIAKEERISDNTIRAIRVREEVTIAERKTALASIFANVAIIGAERMEHLIGRASLNQVAVCAGISTDKFLQLSGEPTQIVEVKITSADDLYSQMVTLKAKLEAERPVIDAEFQPLPTVAPVPQLPALAGGL